MLRFLATFLLAIGLTQHIAAQTLLTTDNLSDYRPDWFYREGDDTLRSHADYPVTGWERVWTTEFFPETMPERGWTGIGWFRTRILVDSSLVGVPLALALFLRGAAELYVDGELVEAHGRVSVDPSEEVAVSHHLPNLRPGSFVFDRPGEYAIAVRTSNHSFSDGRWMGLAVGGFQVWLAPVRDAMAAVTARRRGILFEQALFIGIPLAFAAVFLLLFAFYRSETAHLLFGLLCVCSGLLVFLDLQSELVYFAGAYTVLRQALIVSLAATLILLAATTYLLFEVRVPRHFWILLAVGTGLGIWGTMRPFAAVPLVSMFSLLVLLELIRVTIGAFLKGRKRVWIVATGLLIMIAGVAYDNLLDLGVIDTIGRVTNGYYYGSTILQVSMAVFLAVAFANTNRRLERKLVEVEDLSRRAIEHERQARDQEIERVRLEGDNKRKAIELEKAEQLRESYQALEKAHKRLKETQASLVHSEKMASLGRLVSGIAHEIQNPLNFVNNFSGLTVELAEELRAELEAHDAAESEAVDLADTILENARRISQHGASAGEIVRGMMAHASVRPGEPRVTDLNELVDTVVNVAHRSAQADRDGVEIVVARNLDDEVGSIVIVPESLSRALLNILDNAFDAAIGTGSGEALPTVSVSTIRLTDTVLIRVRDNGSGIPSELRDRVFEPFFTTKPAGSGTGLGLSLAHDIVVDGHGGTIGIENLESKGTGIFLTLPVSD